MEGVSDSRTEIGVRRLEKPDVRVILVQFDRRSNPRWLDDQGVLQKLDALGTQQISDERTKAVTDVSEEHVVLAAQSRNLPDGPPLIVGGRASQVAARVKEAIDRLR